MLKTKRTSEKFERVRKNKRTEKTFITRKSITNLKIKDIWILQN